MLAPFEIDLAIFLLVTATDVARRQSSVVIPSSGPPLNFRQPLMRLRFRDFDESRRRLEPKDWRERSKSLERHNNLNEIDLLALLQGHDRLLPMRLAPEIRPAFAFLFAGVVAGVHANDLLV